MFLADVSALCRNCVGALRTVVETVVETVVNFVETVTVSLKISK